MARKVTIPLNPMPDNTARTIKGQYFKNSLANFMRNGSVGATGIIEVVFYEKDNRG